MKRSSLFLAGAVAALGLAIGATRAVNAGQCTPQTYQFAQCSSTPNQCMTSMPCYPVSGTCADGTAFAALIRTAQPIRYCVSQPYYNQTCTHDDRVCGNTTFYKAGGSCVVVACTSSTIACGCG